ncbi:MAG TPA: nucleotidyltransferase domain-containing protein, partial [Ktedonobacterales bacterium]
MSADGQVHTTLSERELATLIERFGGDEGVEALGLTGSYARGRASAYSDVDLLRFVAQEPESERAHYRLWRVDGRLVSVSTTTLANKRAELTRPQMAIWAVGGLRQMRILADRAGGLAALVAEARAFTWTPALRAAAAEHASETLADLAEEAQKALGARQRGDESAMLYAALGLQQLVIRAALVARGVLLDSENEWFDAALRLEPQDSRWRRLLRVVAGYDAPPIGIAPARERTEAALWLYVEATRLLADTLTAEDAALVAETVARIRAAL